MKHKDLSVRVPIELDNPSILRIEDKCISCGLCKNVCQNDIGVLGTYTLKETLSKQHETTVNVELCSFQKPITIQIVS